MREVEAKILEVDKEKTVQKILELGGKKIFDGEITGIFFDKNNELKNSGKLLRLRKEGDKTKLTFKQKISKEQTKTSQETELEVDDFEKARKVLEGLGFETGKKHPKHRESYKTGNVRFEFDTFQGVPTFLEIEAEDENTVLETAEKLGFKKEDLKSWTGKDVLKHYGKF